MSDRLAVSASLSVLMMSAFVLFANGPARLPLDPPELDGRHATLTDGLAAYSLKTLEASR